MTVSSTSSESSLHTSCERHTPGPARGGCISISAKSVTNGSLSRRIRACRAVAALHAPGLIATSHRAIRARSRWHRVRGLLNRDLVVRSASLSAATVWRSPHGAATACCLSDAVRAPAHVACGFAQWSSGKDSRAPGCPLSHDTKQLSMDLCVSSLALAASLTSQYWSNWSPGRLPDLGW